MSSRDPVTRGPVDRFDLSLHKQTNRTAIIHYRGGRFAQLAKPVPPRDEADQAESP